MRLRFFELGIGLLVTAILNLFFGYWINIVMVIVGIMCLVFSFLETGNGRIRHDDNPKV